MQLPPDSRKARAGVPDLGVACVADAGGKQLPPRANARHAAQELIATIGTGHSSQIRVHLSRWREQSKVEIREATATIPGIFMPTPNGINLDIAKLDELIAA